MDTTFEDLLAETSLKWSEVIWEMVADPNHPVVIMPKEQGLVLVDAVGLLELRIRKVEDE